MKLYEKRKRRADDKKVWVTRQGPHGPTVSIIYIISYYIERRGRYEVQKQPVGWSSTLEGETGTAVIAAQRDGSCLPAIRQGRCRGLRPPHLCCWGNRNPDQSGRSQNEPGSDSGPNRPAEIVGLEPFDRSDDILLPTRREINVILDEACRPGADKLRSGHSIIARSCHSVGVRGRCGRRRGRRRTWCFLSLSSMTPEW